MSDKKGGTFEETVAAMVELRREKFNAHMKEIECAEEDIKRIRAKISAMDVEFQKNLQTEQDFIVDKVVAEILADQPSKEGN